MKLKFRKKTSERAVARLTKKVRVRKKVVGTEERPRLSIFRSSKHMYAQIIDDVTGTTLAAASSVTLKSDESGKALAKLVGQEIAKAAKAKKIENVVFDRNGFIYHGRVQALAEGAREAGLKF
ncbi:MAG: 50S ribosomal protein L18 [Proteobacteria bacterium]|jgi:large subunit ribosomal protein L18|nr:50S ribosomal protein L18 [Pseudomonadota bacterium]